MNRLAVLTLLLMPCAAVTAPAVAQDSRPQSRNEVKCAHYAKAWSDALARRGSRELGRDFLAAHEAFVASGCTARGTVCPVSAEELDFANIVAVLSMNAGTGGTFLPFSCRK